MAGINLEDVHIAVACGRLKSLNFTARADAADGIEAVFSDVTDLIGLCRFSDCAHVSEPGCAVQAAIAAGTLDPDRLTRWEKLRREDQFNTETVAQHHARARKFGKQSKQGKERMKHKRGEM